MVGHLRHRCAGRGELTRFASPLRSLALCRRRSSRLAPAADLFLLLQHLAFKGARYSSYDASIWNEGKLLPLGVAAIFSSLCAGGVAAVSMDQVVGLPFPHVFSCLQLTSRSFLCSGGAVPLQRLSQATRLTAESSRSGFPSRRPQYCISRLGI